MFKLLAIIAFTAVCSSAQNSLPVRLSPTTVDPGTSGICPANDAIQGALNTTTAQLPSVLCDTIIPALAQRNPRVGQPPYSQPPCACGGAGNWTRLAYLNMSHPREVCPPNWNLTTALVGGQCIRTCGGPHISARTCYSAFFPSGGVSYSRVCGRVISYQRDREDAFHLYIRGAIGVEQPRGLNDSYVAGASLTRGTNRQHIWTFAAAWREQNVQPYHVCDCTVTTQAWPYNTPPFVGSDYFCDTGNPTGTQVNGEVYYDDPLWDGQGCGPNNGCCQFNTPPWFCKALPQSTSDDLELRLCTDFDQDTVLVSLIDIYVK